MKIHSFANTSLTQLADRIRTSRRNAGLSQTEFAKNVRVSPSAVAQWEHPKGTRPSLNNLVRIAAQTTVSLEWLITGNGRHKSTAASEAEYPAVVLDTYARNLQEETLLHLFREMPARCRDLVIGFAEELSRRKRSPSVKPR